MNIFVVDSNPYEAARSLCDAHVVKMIVESCQLLSTHDRLTVRFTDDDGLFKATHIYHPCRTCMDGNESNRKWLIHHLHGLLEEYTYRFGKVHKCQEMANKFWPVDKAERVYNYYSLCTDFPLCMPARFIVGPQLGLSRVVNSYRAYYQHKKLTMKRFKYTRRDSPDWLT